MLRAWVMAFAGLTTLLVASPAAGSVLCVQQSLTELGYDPGPADGLMGRRTAGAGAAFATESALDLPPLSAETSDRWCEAIHEFAASMAGPLAARRELLQLPKAELIEVSAPRANGLVTISGAAQSVPPGHRIVAVNLDTGGWADGVSSAEGSFSLTARGAEGAVFEVYATPRDPVFLTHLQDFAGLGTIVYNAPPVLRDDGSASFTAAGQVGRHGGSFVFRGELPTATFPSGSAPRMIGTLVLRSPAIDARFDDMPLHLEARMVLAPMSDADGHPNFMPFDHLGYSTLLTPTGIGLTGVSNLIRIANASATERNFTRDGNELRVDLSFQTDPAYQLPDGYYAIALEIFIGRSGDLMQALSDSALLAAPAPDQIVADNLYPHWTGAAIQIGEPAALRVPWVLLYNTLSQGSRGVVADEDRDHFSLRNKIVFEAPHFVVPREDERDGEPIAYRLEPFLPTFAQNNKSVLYRPLASVARPGGELRVEIENPDGSVTHLGTAPFAQARIGETDGVYPSHKFGETSVMSPLELTTMDERFSHVFTQYGRHVVTMTGFFDDGFGHRVEGGGKYEIWVARTLNVAELGTFLGTPFEVGDFFAPGLRVEPGVPADVEMEFSLYRNSSPDNVLRRRISGTANAYGYFHPPLGSEPLRIDAPGEYVVDVTARYWAPDGTLWMGSRRGANVVETPNGQLVAHGRRGADRVRMPNRPQWFFLNNYAHNFRSFGLESLDITFPVPFASGDVTWATDHNSNGGNGGNNEISPAIRVQDLGGDIEAALLSRFGYRDDGVDGPIRTLARIGELPLFMEPPINTRNPVPSADDYRNWAYFYHVTMRPGIGVRAILDADDHGGIGKYWTFGDPYNLQPGMGPNGDLPGDIKLMFGGAVYRDLDRDINQYAIHGTMAVITDDDDPMGERTAPPFRGAGGGPDGGPLLTIRGEDIDLFVTPTGVRPGEILTPGDTFAFSGQFWPLLPSKISVTVTAPDGTRRVQSGVANKIGFYYDPTADFVVDQPGRWQVTVEGFHDGPISAGLVGEPYPRGGILGSATGTYDFYVVQSADSPPRIETAFVQPAASPLVLTGTLPDGLQQADIAYTVTMPGLILDAGELQAREGRFSYTYDPVALRADFHNIDIRNDSNRGPVPQSVDIVTFSFLIDSDAGPVVRRALLQGELLHQASLNAFPIEAALVNLAQHAAIRASRSLANEPPGAAADGNIESAWGSGSDAPQWIEFAFDKPAEIHEISLAVAQYPNGRTVHGILVRPPGSRDWRRLGEFAGSTFDGQVLSFAPDEPMMDVGAIRIETSASPSWVAWREITILGRQP